MRVHGDHCAPARVQLGTLTGVEDQGSMKSVRRVNGGATDPGGSTVPDEQVRSRAEAHVKSTPMRISDVCFDEGIRPRSASRLRLR